MIIIKKVIEINKLACDNIASLEDAIQSFDIKNDKDKANFGNLCVILKGFRMVADGTEALLVNDDVLKGEDGEFYQKVKDDIVPPSTEGKAGSDYDIDSKEAKHE